jgi:hypothetical protein
MGVTDNLFMEILAVVKMVYPDAESEAVAILPIKTKYDTLLCDLALEAFKKGQKMATADSKDDKMYTDMSSEV